MIIKSEKSGIEYFVDFVNDMFSLYYRPVVYIKSKFLWWKYYKRVWQGSLFSKREVTTMYPKIIKREFELIVEQYEEYIDAWKTFKEEEN